MGEVVIMNKFFDKSNFLLNDFTDRQKKQSLFVSILLIVFFLASSFTFINGLYAFVDVIGSISCRFGPFFSFRRASGT